MNRIRLLRKSKKLSQQDLAMQLNVAQNTISQWENEQRDIDSEKLQILADFFNVSIDYLLGISDDPRPFSPTEDEQNEIWEIRQDMKDEPKLKVLFNLGKKAKTKDLEFVMDFLERVSKGCSGDDC